MAEEKNITNEMENKLEIAAELLANGATLKDIKGLTEEQMEAIYTMGCNFYKTGRLDEAETIFKSLVLLNHLSQKYWIGMGAVHQVKRNFEQAHVAYEYAALLDISNPKPIYHAAECYLALGSIQDAEATLDALEQQCEPTSDVNKLYLEKGQKLRQLIADIKAANEKKD